MAVRCWMFIPRHPCPKGKFVSHDTRLILAGMALSSTFNKFGKRKLFLAVAGHRNVRLLARLAPCRMNRKLIASTPGRSP